MDNWVKNLRTCLLRGLQSPDRQSAGCKGHSLYCFICFFPSLQIFYTEGKKKMWAMPASDDERSSKALSRHSDSVSRYTLWPLTFCILSLQPSHLWPFAGSPPPPPPPAPPPPPSLRRKSQCFSDTGLARRTLSPDDAQTRLATPTRPNCRYFVATMTEKLVARTARSCVSRRLWTWRFLSPPYPRGSGDGGGERGWTGREGGRGGRAGFIVCLRLSCPSVISSASQWRSRLQSRYLWN